MKIGFAIVTYNEPAQLLRLVTTLNRLFGDPPIACHHDFGQCALDEKLFPANVRFVRPHFITRWGHISISRAALKAFGLLMENHKPDWFVLLSGSDYPVRHPDEIKADLSSTPFDAFLDHREIVSDEAPVGEYAQSGFDRADWIPLAYKRYCASRFWWPQPSRRLLIGNILPFRRNYVAIKNRKIESVMQRLHFGRPSRFFAGDFWFQANRKAMGTLMDQSIMRRLLAYYKKREIPEESLFHTALCSNADLKICKSHKRYADWTGNGAHPKWLDGSDLANIRASGAHFARKFRSDGIVQDVLDQTVLGI